MEGRGFNVFIPVSLFFIRKTYNLPNAVQTNMQCNIYLVLFNGLTCRGMNNKNLRRLEGGQVWVFNQELSCVRLGNFLFKSVSSVTWKCWRRGVNNWDRREWRTLLGTVIMITTVGAMELRGIFTHSVHPFFVRKIAKSSEQPWEKYICVSSSSWNRLGKLTLLLTMNHCAFTSLLRLRQKFYNSA